MDILILKVYTTIVLDSSTNTGEFCKNNAYFPFSGNTMNYAIMSRIDVARRALTGGKGLPVASINKSTLQAEGYNLNGSSWPCTLSYTIAGKTYRYRINKTSAKQVNIAQISLPPAPRPDTTPQGTFVCDVDMLPDTVTRGVIRQIGDKDLDRNWDADAPRFALEFFSTDNGIGTGIRREFYMSDEDPDMEPFFTQFDVSPYNGTNAGNALMQAIHYIRYCPPHTGSGYWTPSYTYHGYGTKWDPFYRGQGGALAKVWCTKNFVIIISDGEANSDQAVNTDPHLPARIFPTRPLYNYDNVWDNYDDCSGWGDDDHPADDYAYFAHIQDLRPASEPACSLNGMQNITFYALMTFGTGTGLFQKVAMNGGFEDENGDLVPQPNEYDKDGNGVPDNYFNAQDGYEIEEAIQKILMDILAKVSSSSGVAVVTAGAKVGGSTVQAQFYPRKQFPTGEVLDWVGTCQSLWLDEFGYIREDNVADAHLDLKNDYVITMQWDGVAQNVIITRYQDLYGNGDSLALIGTAPIEDLKPVWDAGKWLWDHFNPPNTRNIFTRINNTKTDFTTANLATIKPHLGIGLTDAVADTIIKYIRGSDIDTLILRSRTADGKAWKLGDIVSSGPVLISAPIERYDFIYGDVSYSRYYNNYKSRRQVVYLGSNDGMLHAFNAGFPVKTGLDTVPLYINPGGYDLGEELWAYIPYNLLPHLKWLKDPTYGKCHVYYVDMKAYVTDAQIFKAESLDGVHTGGWGTMLFGGMRLGGTEIRNDVDTCRSAYFALDITDPLNPVPLWEFERPELRYTVCYPTVVKVKTKWFLVFGSGPMNCGGESSQNAQVYVIDLKTGNLLRTITLTDTRSFISDIFACDWGIDYNVDRIYFGDCIYDGVAKAWRGKAYRILTNDDEDPNTWTMSMIMDMQQPITAEGSVATDEYDHLWVYFGTGRLFSDNDELEVTKHCYVGFRDDTTHTTDPSMLFNVTNYGVDTLDLVQPGNLVFDSLVSMVGARGGWYRQFKASGERNLTTSLIIGGAVLFTTFMPSGDICSFGGEGNLYALYYKTGTAYTKAFLGDTLGYNRYYLGLGTGMPSEPALYVGADQTKVFIQVGGGIVSPETGIEGLPRAGVILWKGK